MTEVVDDIGRTFRCSEGHDHRFLARNDTFQVHEAAGVKGFSNDLVDGFPSYEIAATSTDDFGFTRSEVIRNEEGQEVIQSASGAKRHDSITSELFVGELLLPAINKHRGSEFGDLIKYPEESSIRDLQAQDERTREKLYIQVSSADSRPSASFGRGEPYYATQSETHMIEELATRVREKSLYDPK